MDLEGIMLNEVSLTEKDKYCMISLMWNIKHKQEQKKNEKKPRQSKHRYRGQSGDYQRERFWGGQGG